MSYISEELRRLVAERASYRCEYCHSAELVTGGPFHVDHVRIARRARLTASPSASEAEGVLAP